MRKLLLFGGSFLRLDIPRADREGLAATQFYGPSAIYCVTPTTEAIARAVPATSQPEPVARWELPAPGTASEDEAGFDEDPAA